jgi:hypothetical protein
LESSGGLQGHVCTRSPQCGVLLIPFSSLFIVEGYRPFSGDIINIAMVMNTTNSSGVGRMWLSAIPGDSYPDPPTILQFTNPTQFSVGSNKFGVIELTERRKITPSYIDMMGFTPVCDILLTLFLTWLIRLIDQSYKSIGLMSIRQLMPKIHKRSSLTSPCFRYNGRITNRQ